MLDASETTPMTTTRSLDLTLFGAGLELGAAARGAAMAPQALRTAGLVRVLADLGHRVSDRGTLHGVAPEPVAMAPAHASRCNHLAGIAGWTRTIHDRAHAMASEASVPIFLGVVAGVL